MTKYDAIKALESAALSYKSIQPTLPSERLTVIDDPETDVQCYIRQHADRMEITFRGSNSCKDWLTDFRFWKKVIPYRNPGSPIRVHSGFLGAYKNEHIRTRLHELMTRNMRRIRVMGHSYGAALAVLCAVDLEYHFPGRDYEVFLYGCPRVGNRAFRKSYNKRVFKTLRVENGNDIVTKVPPALFGFCHVGIRIPVGAPRVPLLFSAKEHSMQSYYGHFFTSMKP